MFRFITPIILIGISVAAVFMFTDPLYKDIASLKAQAVSFNEALDNSKALEAERDKLTQKYNSIDPDNLVKLEKLLPDNVDNIRLILEIEKIASPYGMVLKDVKYDTTSPKEIAAKEKTTATGATTAEAEAPNGGAAVGKTNSQFGTWNLEFSTQGSYSNFLHFVKDLEKNLRIVDISAIEFSSENTENAGQGTKVLSSDNYKYTFKIKTYWLKD